MALFVQLQTTYKIIKREFDNWNTQSDKAVKHIDSLVNLTDQYESCSSADLRGVSLDDCPDFKSSLMNQIEDELHDDLEKIHAVIDIFQEITSKIYKQLAYCLERLQSSDEAIVATELRPSLIILVERITDVHRMFYEETEIRRYQLAEIKLTDHDGAEKFKEVWLLNKNMKKTISYYLAEANFFVKEDPKTLM